MSEEVTATPVSDGVVITTAEPTQEPKQAAELAPASETEHEKTPVDSEYSEGAKKAINKKHWQAEEAKRETAALRAELDQLKAGSVAATVEPKDVPVIDENLYGEELTAALQERDAIVVQNAEISADARFNEKQQQSQYEESLRQQQATAKEMYNDFLGKAVEQGFEAEEVSSAATDISQYGVSDAVAGMIVADADGGAMAMYLRQNPQELQNLQTMPVHMQVTHMNNVIRQGAESIKPKTSNAPPPPTDITAGGPLTTVDPLLEGATFNTY